MKASIIIVIFNGRKYLGRCLTSVLSEVREGDEIIVVDNASTDGSGRWIQEWWPEVLVITNTANQGFAIACNQGAKRAANEILVFLNQDTRVLLGWLEGLRGRLSADPQVGLVTSKVLMMDNPEIIQTCGLVVHFSGLTSADGFCERASVYRVPARVGAVCGASFAIRKAVWDSLGGFDERMEMYFEDVDLSWRAIRQGWRCELVPGSTVEHKQVWMPSARVLDYMARNRYLLVCKNLCGLTSLMLLPGLLIAEAADWGYALLRGNEAMAAKWRAWGWLAGNIKAVLAARQAIGRGRDLAILENCTYQLTPRLLDGGCAGRALTRLCNLVMYLNYKVAIWLVRLFKI
jgi:GT2 family glycosyltransferase